MMNSVRQWVKRRLGEGHAALKSDKLAPYRIEDLYIRFYCSSKAGGQVCAPPSPSTPSPQPSDPRPCMPKGSVRLERLWFVQLVIIRARLEREALALALTLTLTLLSCARQVVLLDVNVT